MAPLYAQLVDAVDDVHKYKDGHDLLERLERVSVCLSYYQQTDLLTELHTVKLALSNYLSKQRSEFLQHCFLRLFDHVMQALSLFLCTTDADAELESFLYCSRNVIYQLAHHHPSIVQARQDLGQRLALAAAYFLDPECNAELKCITSLVVKATKYLGVRNLTGEERNLLEAAYRWHCNQDV